MYRNLYLLFFITSIANANYVSLHGNITYSKKELCEQSESAKCYEKPIDSDDKKLTFNGDEPVWVLDEEKVAKRQEEAAKEAAAIEELKTIANKSTITNKELQKALKLLLKRLSIEMDSE
jgi:endonuclease/exonuclease/phosphatase (EEP) superfamily protein YafD